MLAPPLHSRFKAMIEKSNTQMPSTPALRLNRLLPLALALFFANPSSGHAAPGRSGLLPIGERYTFESIEKAIRQKWDAKRVRIDRMDRMLFSPGQRLLADLGIRTHDYDEYQAEFLVEFDNAANGQHVYAVKCRGRDIWDQPKPQLLLSSCDFFRGDGRRVPPAWYTQEKPDPGRVVFLPGRVSHVWIDYSELKLRERGSHPALSERNSVLKNKGNDAAVDPAQSAADAGSAR